MHVWADKEVFGCLAYKHLQRVFSQPLPCSLGEAQPHPSLSLSVCIFCECVRTKACVHVLARVLGTCESSESKYPFVLSD